MQSTEIEVRFSLQCAHRSSSRCAHLYGVISRCSVTAAAIAAIIVQASRAQYQARGKPCACPDDTMRNGRACGSRSAYSRPGGAAPLCYPTDVTAATIESYRQRQASRLIKRRFEADDDNLSRSSIWHARGGFRMLSARSTSLSGSMRSTIRETSRQSAPSASASSMRKYVMRCSSS
jgi:hypothetical protein